jgi:hypothetical protein
MKQTPVLPDCDFLAIANWERYESRTTSENAKNPGPITIRFMYPTNMMDDSNYLKLTGFQKHLFWELCAYRARSRKNIPNDVASIGLLTCMLPRERPLIKSSVRALYEQGFLVPSNQQDNFSASVSASGSGSASESESVSKQASITKETSKLGDAVSDSVPDKKEETQNPEVDEQELDENSESVKAVNLSRWLAGLLGKMWPRGRQPDPPESETWGDAEWKAWTDKYPMFYPDLIDRWAKETAPLWKLYPTNADYYRLMGIMLFTYGRGDSKDSAYWRKVTSGMKAFVTLLTKPDSGILRQFDDAMYEPEFWATGYFMTPETNTCPPIPFPHGIAEFVGRPPDHMIPLVNDFLRKHGVEPEVDVDDSERGEEIDPYQTEAKLVFEVDEEEL